MNHHDVPNLQLSQADPKFAPPKTTSVNQNGPVALFMGRIVPASAHDTPAAKAFWENSIRRSQENKNQQTTSNKSKNKRKAKHESGAGRPHQKQQQSTHIADPRLHRHRPHQTQPKIPHTLDLRLQRHRAPQPQRHAPHNTDPRYYLHPTQQTQPNIPKTLDLRLNKNRAPQSLQQSTHNSDRRHHTDPTHQPQSQIPHTLDLRQRNQAQQGIHYSDPRHNRHRAHPTQQAIPQTLDLRLRGRASQPQQTTHNSDPRRLRHPAHPTQQAFPQTLDLRLRGRAPQTQQKSLQPDPRHNRHRAHQSQQNIPHTLDLRLRNRASQQTTQSHPRHQRQRAGLSARDAVAGHLIGGLVSHIGPQNDHKPESVYVYTTTERSVRKSKNDFFHISDHRYSHHMKHKKLKQQSIPKKKSNHNTHLPSKVAKGFTWFHGTQVSDKKNKTISRPYAGYLDIIEQAKKRLEAIRNKTLGGPPPPSKLNKGNATNTSNVTPRPRNNIPGVTKAPFITATMLGADRKNTTDIPEEIEINGTSYDSPHDLKPGQLHPTDPRFFQGGGSSVGSIPGIPGPPPPLSVRPSNRRHRPPPPNVPLTVTKRPFITATMLGADRRNTTDIPEEIEINGTSYDSPHDMKPGQLHPTDPRFVPPGPQAYGGGGGVGGGPERETETAENGGPATSLHISFGNPTPPPPMFSDVLGMTTTGYFGGSQNTHNTHNRHDRHNVNAPIEPPGPPPPAPNQLVPAVRHETYTLLPTYRTVPATYAPPRAHHVYTVPPTYAPPPPNPRYVTAAPTPPGPPPPPHEVPFQQPVRKTISVSHTRTHHQPASYHMPVHKPSSPTHTQTYNHHPPRHEPASLNPPVQEPVSQTYVQHQPSQTAKTYDTHHEPVPRPTSFVQQRPESQPQRSEQHTPGQQNNKMVNTLNMAIGGGNKSTQLASKYANTIEQALQGRVKNAIDKAITSKVLDTLDHIITARIESLLGGISTTIENRLKSIAVPTTASKLLVQSTPSRSTPKRRREVSGFNIENIPYRGPQFSMKRTHILRPHV